MAEEGYKRRFFVTVLLALALLLVGGCSSKKAEDTPAEEEEQQAADPQEDEQLYILLYSNTETNRVFLQGSQTGRQEEFEYNGGTYIRGRYDESLTMGELKVGELLKLTYTDKKVLTEIQVAKDAFFYEGITDFSIREDEAVFSAGDSNYYYNEDLKIFSQDGIISLNELSSLDTVCLRGMGKQIMTIVVTRGHGTLVFRNTELFEGGMVTVGNAAAQTVSRDMTMEVPEGTHVLSVAHEGYGGSKEITVGRFEELLVDLNTMKGDGPQHGRVKINVTPENAKVTIDGGLVDCSQVLEMEYGTYRLKAKAEGYEDWSGHLVIKGPNASVDIEMDKLSEEDEEESKETSDQEKESQEESKK